MKILLLISISFFISFCVHSQADTMPKADTNVYRIIKTDGGELFGKILKQDAREVLIITKDNREVYIPQHVIKKMEIIDTKDFNASGTFIGDDKFATRYFLTTNGLPVVKGEHYVQWNLFGPDFQFGLGNNFGVGVMTSWIGMPIIGTIKKSWQLSDNAHIALGGLLGTGTWIIPDFGGALPFATLSFGDRRTNIAFSSGYGAIWAGNGAEGRWITSVAGMVKLSPKITLVFDSFILMPAADDFVTTSYNQEVYNPTTMMYESQLVTYEENRSRPGFGLLIPGLRWHQAEGQAFQFGFTGIFYDNDIVPVPIPMVQWYRSL